MKVFEFYDGCVFDLVVAEDELVAQEFYYEHVLENCGAQLSGISIREVDTRDRILTDMYDETQTMSLEEANLKLT